MFSLNHLDATEFEEFVYDLLAAIGYKNLSWRKGTGIEGASPADQGRDIEGDEEITERDGRVRHDHWFIECKHHRRGVPPEKLEGALAWAQAHSPDFLLFVCSQFLSNPAKNYLTLYAENRRPKFKIRFWERKDLERLAAEHSQLQSKYRLTNEAPGCAAAQGMDLACTVEGAQNSSGLVQAATRRSNEATEKSIDIAERSLELESCAWLHVSIKTIPKNSVLAAGYDIEITNQGKTPAVEVEIRYQTYLSKSAEIPDEILSSTNQEREAGIVINEGREAGVHISPNATHKITLRWDPAGREIWEENAAGKLATQHPLIFYCEITYRDIFGKQHKTVVCRQSAAKASTFGGQEWVSVPKHNRIE